MLAEINYFKENQTVYLVSNSGIQFLDFGINISNNEPAGLFSLLNTQQVVLLAEDEHHLFYSINEEVTAENKIKIKNESYALRTEKSLDLLNGHWLPLPFLRYNNDHYDNGPTNWARIRFIELNQPDLDGNTHRITIAFDTKLMRNNENMRYIDLAPNSKDVEDPALFKMALGPGQTKWFFDQEWVSSWLMEIFKANEKNPDSKEFKIEQDEKHHIAHYLNILKLISPIANHPNKHKPKIELPQVQLIDQTGKNKHVIPVDLILDIGNSRTCGILVENQTQSANGLKDSYLLKLRDLSNPEKIYTDPFESRVEFTQTSFEKGNFSRQSGRMDAFLWPTFVRVGHEANHLASMREGSDGSTGISSPKRYLWDKNRYEHGWVFNKAHSNQSDVKAMCEPFSSHIDGAGEALYTHDEEERYAVLNPVYSRSSLSTFMLAEVITHALNQINSVTERRRQGLSSQPRRLNSITLTVPPGMPLVERSILNDRLQQAIALVWKCLGWDLSDEDPHTEENQTFPPGANQSSADNEPNAVLITIPKTHVKWDEASCGQLVYLYTEITNNFDNQSKAFFSSLAKPDKEDRDSITLATIDIGGGTTDLVVTKYHLVGSDNSAHIVPTQLFRDGYKVAGDDILLDVIQQYILPSFADALRAAEVQEIDTLLSTICGSDSIDSNKRLLRQQLNLQLFTPLGLAIIALYEQYDPNSDDSLSGKYTYSDLLPQVQISEAVTDYVNKNIRYHTGTHSSDQDIDLLNTTIDLNFQAIHAYFLAGANIIKPLNAFSKVIFKYDCDMLLLTGRPSRLPGVQELIRRLCPMPPGRILPMHNYHTGSWYPFHKNKRIDDPKTTASVGALLCLLSITSRLENFNFRAADLKPYSTIRHFGIIDNENNIPAVDVIFSDIKTKAIETNNDNEVMVLPMGDDGQVPPIPMRGSALRLGFRQLGVESWTATPLYTMEFIKDGPAKYNSAKVRDGLTDEMPIVYVTLAVIENSTRNVNNPLISDELVIESVSCNTDKTFRNSDIKLELNTMLEAKSNQGNYWLDSGSVKI